MKISSVTLTNFGPHEKLDAKFGGSTIGIMGPNGQGKSILLEAIKFAFTGELTDNANTYVRFWGHPEKGASNGSVEVKFSKHGIDGTIFRQVGKSPKRWLDWEGHRGDDKLTKSADIEKVLSDLLGADRRAVAEAVFIRQASLDKLLFAEDKEDREMLFVRLLLLSHLQKVSDACEAQAAILSNQLVDNTATLDQLRGQVIEINRNLEEMTRNPVIDYRPDVACLQQWGQNSNAFNREAANHKAFTEDRNTKMVQMRDWLGRKGLDGNKPYSEILGELQQRIGKYEEKLPALDAEANRLRNLENMKKSFDRLTASRAVHLNDIASIQNQLDVLGAAPDSGVIEFMRQQADQAARQEKDNARRETLMSLISGGSSRMPALMEQIDANQEALAVQEQQHREVLTQQLAVKAEVDLLDLLKKQPNSKCQTCGSEISQDRIAAMEASGSRVKLEGLSIQLFNVSEDIQKLRKELGVLQLEQRGLGQNMKTWADELPTLLPAANVLVSSAELRQRLQTEEKRVKDANELQQRMGTVRGALQAVEKELEQFASQMEVMLSFDPAQLAAADKAAADCRQAATDARNLHTAVFNASGALQELDAKINQSFEQQKILQSTLAAMEAAFTPVVRAALTEGLGNDHALQRVQELQNAENLRAGEIAASLKLQKDVQGRIDAIELRARLDEGKRVLIRDLKRMQLAFSRKGISADFISDRFRKLAELTRINLAEQDANFTVEVSPDTPMTFNFVRLDNSVGYVMTQGKLSGGQRVRLAVSFLMSVQQLVIPQVGLLSLDEPSMHLDEDGVEHLRELLDSMGRKLQSSDAQVIVCDHNKLLEPAFSSVIRL